MHNRQDDSIQDSDYAEGARIAEAALQAHLPGARKEIEGELAADSSAHFKEVLLRLSTKHLGELSGKKSRGNSSN